MDLQAVVAWCQAGRTDRLTIEGAAGTAFLIRADETLAQNVTAVHCDVGMTIAAPQSRLRLIGSTFRENRIAVRFAYEWHDDGGNWFHSYGNENWDSTKTMRLRIASINDAPIKENERKYHWLLGPRPDDHSSLSDLGL